MSFCNIATTPDNASWDNLHLDILFFFWPHLYYVLLKYQPRNYFWNKGQDIIEREKRGIRQERERQMRKRGKERDDGKSRKAKTQLLLLLV